MTTSSDAEVTIDQLAPVVERAATDPAFRQQLLTSPTATLESAGIVIPAGAQVQIVEDTQDLRHAVIGSRPDALSDADLAQAISESLPSPGSVEDNIASFSQLVARSWTDSALRSQLLSDPAGTLAAHGIQVPAGVSVKAIESSPASLVLAVPPAAAMTTTNSSSPTSVGSIAESITGSFTNLTKLITAGSYLAGLGFSIGAIMKFKQHKDNPTQVPIGTPIALEFIAAALLFLPSILSVAGETMFGSGTGAQ